MKNAKTSAKNLNQRDLDERRTYILSNNKINKAQIHGLSGAFHTPTQDRQCQEGAPFPGPSPPPRHRKPFLEFRPVLDRSIISGARLMPATLRGRNRSCKKVLFTM